MDERERHRLAKPIKAREFYRLRKNFSAICLGISIVIFLFSIVISIIIVSRLRAGYALPAAATYATPALILLATIATALSWHFYAKNADLFCSDCGKFIDTYNSWICGFCEKTIHSTFRFSFLSCCEVCGRSPDTVICPHCEGAVFLDASLITGGARSPHAARIVRPATVAAAPIDPAEEKAKAHTEQLTGLKREIEIAALNRQLAQLKASPEFQKELSEQEKLEKRFSEYEANKMGVMMLEARQRLKNWELYKNDPDNYERAELVVDAFVMEHGLNPTRRPLK